MPASRRGPTTLWTVLVGFGIVLGALVYLLWPRGAPPVESGIWPLDPVEPLRVVARGSERAWRFSYSGPDGVHNTGDDPVSTGHLMLPAGAHVVVQLRSDDYIYVFSCPDLKLKEIAVPDLEFSIAFLADRPGEYDLAMDPMCGFRLPPGQTMGTLSVASESDFRHWLRDRLRSR